MQHQAAHLLGKSLYVFPSLVHGLSSISSHFRCQRVSLYGSMAAARAADSGVHFAKAEVMALHERARPLHTGQPARILRAGVEAKVICIGDAGSLTPQLVPGGYQVDGTGVPA